MQRRHLARIALALSLLLPALASAQAATVDVAGVKLEDRITLSGSPLLLNGAGVRKRGKVAEIWLGSSKGIPAAELAKVATGPAKDKGVRLGEQVASDLLAIRAGDGSASGPSPVIPIWVSRYRFAR